MMPYDDEDFYFERNYNSGGVEYNRDANWIENSEGGRSPLVDPFSRFLPSKNLYERFSSSTASLPKEEGPSEERSDQEILENVRERLMRSPGADASFVKVKVSQGIVYLFGKVETRAEKKEVESEIEYLPGIVDIINKIKVKRPFADLFPGLKEKRKKSLIDGRATWV